MQALLARRLRALTECTAGVQQCRHSTVYFEHCVLTALILLVIPQRTKNISNMGPDRVTQCINLQSCERFAAGMRTSHIKMGFRLTCPLHWAQCPIEKPEPKKKTQRCFPSCVLNKQIRFNTRFIVSMCLLLLFCRGIHWVACKKRHGSTGFFL